MFRFLGGCFAAAPLTNSGGVIADLWGPERRGDAMAIFALMPFGASAGPCCRFSSKQLTQFRVISRTRSRSHLLRIHAGRRRLLEVDLLGPHDLFVHFGSRQASTKTSDRSSFRAVAGVCGILIVFILPETYLPAIMAAEAKRLRQETGDDRWHADLDKKQPAGVKAVLQRTVLKPFIMLFDEPMLAVITMYMSLV